MEKYLYLALNIGTIILPFLWSFDKKVSYFKKWFALWPAILLTAVIFLIWDYEFTQMGVWGFNAQYLSGIYLGPLPLEECLFFITVPYSCIFIYEVLKYYELKAPISETNAKYISQLLTLLLLAMAVIHYDLWYTSVNFAVTALVILTHLWFFKTRFLQRFYLFYLIHLIPFLLVNGALTGAFTPEPVVWYDDAENLGFRIFTIPVEDVFYSLAMMLMNISLYEYFLGRKTLRPSLS